MGRSGSAKARSQGERGWAAGAGAGVVVCEVQPMEVHPGGPLRGKLSCLVALARRLRDDEDYCK